MDGKVDWMAYDLPVEGEDGPFIGERVSPVPTCDAQARVADARRALDESDEGRVVVVAAGLAVGQVDAEALNGHGGEESVLDVMSPVPSTYRPSVTVEALAEDGGGRFLVSTSDGRLLGAVTVEPAEHDHEHPDHHEHAEIDEERFEQDLTDVLAAVEERFGDREPTEEELRALLRERLVGEGRSPEEADRVLDELKAE